MNVMSARMSGLRSPVEIRILVTVVACVVTGVAASAAQPRDGVATDSAQWRRDVATLDAIIEAYYKVVSGPAGGVVDTARDRYLHHAEARVTLYRRAGDEPVRVEVVPLGEYHRRVGVGPRERAFYEREINRVEHVFGNMAVVWSTYEYRESPNGPATGRGINAITLARDADRWWITGWTYESETPSLALPSRYVPRGSRDHEGWAR